MRLTLTLFTLFGLGFASPLVEPVKRQSSTVQTEKLLSLERRLETEVAQFDTSGRTAMASIIDLAYAYQLPIAIEYVDSDFAAHPNSLEFRHESIRSILEKIIAQVPAYRLTFSGNIVDIYVPKARDDSSNFLNKTIRNFVVNDVDTQTADMELVCALARELDPPGGCFGSYAPGQWGPRKVTVHIQNAKVYEVLNAIVAENGKALWTVLVPPDSLSKRPVLNSWHIYPLEPSFKDIVLSKLASISNSAT